MGVRASAVVLSAILAVAAQRAATQAKLTSLLDGNGVMALTVEAPLQKLFADPSEQDATVPGTVTLKDPKAGADVALRDVEVSVRGHTSRRETECTFPKLKLKLKGAGSIKLGTHCGESADDKLSPKYGRLANEKSPHREALAYQMLHAAGVPALRVRPARVTYVDPANAAQPLVRNALLLEDDDDAMARVQGTAELTMENFGNVVARQATEEAALVALGEALIGNFDWCLKFTSDDAYRCDATKPLWNVLAFERGGAAALMVKDLDLAGVVAGRHGWFDTVWNRAFVPSGSPIEIEVLSQVQRTRALFPRDTLDAVRRRFVERKDAVMAAIQSAQVDPAGRDVARAYADAFFTAIADDQAFYRPVVARADVRIFMDATGTKEACGAGDVMRAGTPVNEVQKSGAMSQVIVLDAQWRWASKNECNNVQNGPVWIPSDAITTDFPTKARR
jgi:hypothetical protein